MVQMAVKLLVKDGDKDCGEAGKLVCRADGENEGVYDRDDCGQDVVGYG